MRLQGFASARGFFRKRLSHEATSSSPCPSSTPPALADALDLYGGIPTAESPALPEMTFQPEAVEVVDTPDPKKSTVPAHGYSLAGDRRLSQDWKARMTERRVAKRSSIELRAGARGIA
jgi:hypothetical protein